MGVQSLESYVAKNTYKVDRVRRRVNIINESIASPRSNILVIDLSNLVAQS